MDQNEARDVLAEAADLWRQELRDYIIGHATSDQERRELEASAANIERALHTVRTRYGVIDRRTGANPQ